MWINFNPNRYLNLQPLIVIMKCCNNNRSNCNGNPIRCRWFTLIAAEPSSAAGGICVLCRFFLSCLSLCRCWSWCRSLATKKSRGRSTLSL
ncbi:glycoside hydrolase family, partial [Sesbania bispinosa]